MRERFFVKKDNDNNVIKTSMKNKRGLSRILKGNALSMDAITESTLDTYYNECSESYYTQQVKIRKEQRKAYEY